MKSIAQILDERLTAAMREAAGKKRCAAMVSACTDPAFGDYQANGAMALARETGKDPRQLATKAIETARLDDVCESVETAGPGFINLKLRNSFLADRLMAVLADRDRLGVEPQLPPRTVVVDFSGPNVAKQMHVGHLRSTILGDCICRMLEFFGHKVIRQNHIGDWGTQFGMLIALVKASGRAGAPARIDDMEEFYKEARKRFDSEPEFAADARQIVADLHSGDRVNLEYWRGIVKESRRHHEAVYKMLNVKLDIRHEYSESKYRRSLPEIVAELEKKGIARSSEGAICVFPPGFKNKENEPLAFIIRKSDGAFLYATTDLAALRYRVSELKADRIVYVTDSRQKLHFEMLFATANIAGWANGTELEHVMFGTVLGEDGRPLKTRSGENVRLAELLDEAVTRARSIVQEKNPDLDPGQKDSIAGAVGTGAVKYADYSNSRTSDYVFSFDKMLAMEGNTSPYMQYAYARIRSIERKGAEKGIKVEDERAGAVALEFSEPSERELALCLCRYPEAVKAAAADYRPNFLTGYLYELAQKFSSFYTNCPVLDAESKTRAVRLVLCELTARTMRHGMTELLGIEMPEKM
jgi:arginyl-tRNA synthetase